VEGVGKWGSTTGVSTVKGVCGRSPQWFPEAQPLVRRRSSL